MRVLAVGMREPVSSFATVGCEVLMRVASFRWPRHLPGDEDHVAGAGGERAAGRHHVHFDIVRLRGVLTIALMPREA